MRPLAFFDKRKLVAQVGGPTKYYLRAASNIDGHWAPRGPAVAELAEGVITPAIRPVVVADAAGVTPARGHDAEREIARDGDRYRAVLRRAIAELAGTVFAPTIGR